MPKSAAHLKKHAFKKGQSGNPKGRIPNDAIKALRKITIETYREVIEMVLTGKLADLKALAEHPDTPAIQIGVATSFLKAIKNGDYAVIERLAERIIGKIPDELNVIQNTTVNTKVTDIDREALKKAMAELEDV